jgi:hypothetical protein
MDSDDALVELVNQGWAVTYGPPLTIINPRGDSLDNPTETELHKLNAGATMADIKIERVWNVKKDRSA